MEQIQMLLIEKTQAEIRRRGRGGNEAVAADIRAAYEAQVPASHRSVSWSSSSVTSTRLNSDWIHLRRFLEGTTRIPLELFEPWVSILRAEDQREILSDFCQRFGSMVVPANPAADQCDIEAFSSLMIECGEAVKAIAPMMGDGRIDENDAHLALKATNELNDVIIRATHLRDKIASIRPVNVTRLHARQK